MRPVSPRNDALTTLRFDRARRDGQQTKIDPNSVKNIVGDDVLNGILVDRM